MSAAVSTLPAPSFTERRATNADKRLVRCLVTRADEAFTQGDRIDFDTFASAAAFRLGVDEHGLDAGQRLAALRRALLAFVTLALVALMAGCSLHAEVEDDSPPPAEASAPCASPDSGAPPTADAAPDAGPAVDGAAAPASLPSCEDVHGAAGLLELDTAAPTQMPTTGGQLVTLTGSGFCQLEEVELGAEGVDFVLVDDQHLLFRTPAPIAQSAGPVQVVLYGPGGVTVSIDLTAVTP